MKIRFSIDYRTYWGQKMMLVGSARETGEWEISNAVPLDFRGGETWETEIEFDSEISSLEYMYLIVNENTGEHELEFGEGRTINWSGMSRRELKIRDFWRSNTSEQNAL
ncbi:MAG: carbohydrate-binding module family 20 domain-containing protein, partial [Cyclobacteriaceae bacterium]